MKRLSCLVFILLASGAALAAPTIELSAGMHRIEAEVVSNAADRATGLMNRSELGGDDAAMDRACRARRRE